MAPAPEAPTYALFTLGGRPVTGRLGLPPEMAAALGSRWMVYFAAPDVDASADQAGHLGGAVLVPPTDTPTGRVAAIRDPTGATFTLLRPPGGA
jgi:predicted enzyme related to lactoylglutathione lyase